MALVATIKSKFSRKIANADTISEKQVHINKISVSVIARIGIFVALISVSGYISFTLPFTPVAITAQTLVLNLAALVLNPKQTFATVAIYVLLGTIGLPIFSGGRSGLSVIVGPTGGYILAFLVAIPLVSLLKGKKLWRYILATVLVGIPIIDIAGTIFFSITTGTGFVKSLLLCAVPFLIGDVLKAVVASTLGISANKALEKIERK